MSNIEKNDDLYKNLYDFSKHPISWYLSLSVVSNIYKYSKKKNLSGQQSLQIMVSKFEVIEIENENLKEKIKVLKDEIQNLKKFDQENFKDINMKHIRVNNLKTKISYTVIFDTYGWEHLNKSYDSLDDAIKVRDDHILNGKRKLN